MGRHITVRRFVVHADTDDALDKVHEALTGRVNRDVPKVKGAPSSDVTRHRRSSMISVQLTGDPATLDEIRTSVATDGEVRVLQDWLEVQPPPDDRYPDLRALLRIDPEEYSRTVTGTGAPLVVAIIDSGIDVDHPDLANRLWTTHVRGRPVHGIRTMDGALDHDVTDQDGHGTMLAGTILATANRVDDIQLMAVKFYDVMTQPLAANAAAALRSLVDQRPAVINMSFDLGIGSNDLEDAFGYVCGETDALIVIAAGNTGSDNDQYPLVPVCYADKCRDRVIVVMATDWYDEKPTFSNFGMTTVDLAAPGVGIVSTRPRVSRAPEAKKYSRYTGTSAAAAHVSGAAALLKAQDPKRTAGEIKTCLMDSVDRLPRLKCVSGGRLNLGRALRGCGGKSL